MTGREHRVPAFLGLVVLIIGASVAVVIAWRSLAAESAALPPAAPQVEAQPGPSAVLAPDAAPPPVAEPAPPAPATPRGAAVWGQVIDPRGAPVGSATLWFHPRRDELAAREGSDPSPIRDPDDPFEAVWSTLGVRVDADARGDFDSGVLDAGAWLLAVGPPEGPWASVSRELLLADGDDRQLKLVVEAPVTLRGRVLNARGSAARGADVLVEEIGLAPGVRRSLEARSDESGDFSVRVAPSAELRVQATGSGGRETAVARVPAGTSEVTLTFGGPGVK